MKYPKEKVTTGKVIYFLIGFGLFISGVIFDSWINLVAGMFILATIEPLVIISYEGKDE